MWAHAEYIKLVRSLKDGKIFDQPPQTVKRYCIEQRKAVYWSWRFNSKCRLLPQGKDLRVALLSPAMVHWSDDGWRTAHDTHTQESGIGVHFADLPGRQLNIGKEIVFTIFWKNEQRWEGTDFSVTVDPM